LNYLNITDALTDLFASGYAWRSDQAKSPRNIAGWNAISRLKSAPL
jgi:hypothetical protein